MAALPKQVLHMALFLDALRNDIQAETPPKIDHRVNDRITARITFHIAHETAIDLDDIDGKLFQMPQGSIARAEVIESNLDAGGTEQRQGSLHIFRAAPQEDSLGYLDLELGGGYPCQFKLLEHSLGKIFPPEIRR